MTATQTPSETLMVIIADGLDASIDGRGWNEKHQQAANLANAAPGLLEALKGMLRVYGGRSKPEQPIESQAHDAIVAARGEVT